MAKKKKKKRAAPKAKKGRKPGRAVVTPDISVLASYVPTDGASSHPDWVKTRFPDYIGAHAGHEATSVREFSHRGHVVRIVTTYRVEVDGRSARAHLSVDEDGRVYTHATPFVTYDSAINLMRAVIDNYPDSFSGAGGGHDHGHDGHGGSGGHGPGGGHP